VEKHLPYQQRFCKIRPYPIEQSGIKHNQRASQCPLKGCVAMHTQVNEKFRYHFSQDFSGDLHIVDDVEKKELAIIPTDHIKEILNYCGYDLVERALE